MTTSIVLAGFLGVASACSTGAGTAAPGAPGAPQTGAPGSAPSDPGHPSPIAATRYAGKGFVVHEWGTNTIVVGSDGSMQRGLHHEEEDLPSFVYDRIKAGGLGTSVDVKMETPVTYFYSDKAMSAEVSVEFPKGVLTQWYPAARDFFPHVVQPTSNIVDPVMDPHFTSQSLTCAQQFADGKAIGNGLLDWGSVQIDAPDGRVFPPDAPLDKYTWSYARAVASNPVSVLDPAAAKSLQTEKFLFYRGLGNFSLPVTVAASNGAAGYDGGVTLTTRSSDRVGAIFLLKVDANGGAFKVHSEGLGPKETVTDAISGPVQPIDTYADALGAAMVQELDKTGLYHDEALAMVNTWRRQWFKTPGVRVLYLAPQAWTDAQIPLKVKPAPQEMTRVMVIRVEVITRAQEDTDLKFGAALESDANTTAVQHFTELGRFAEPRLRRAMGNLAGPLPKANALLVQLAHANTSAGIGE